MRRSLSPTAADRRRGHRRYHSQYETLSQNRLKRTMRQGGKAGDPSRRTTALRSWAWTRRVGGPSYDDDGERERAGHDVVGPVPMIGLSVRSQATAMRFRVPRGSRSIRRLVYHANSDQRANVTTSFVPGYRSLWPSCSRGPLHRRYSMCDLDCPRRSFELRRRMDSGVYIRKHRNGRIRW
jgi:hypothetical protein